MAISIASSDHKREADDSEEEVKADAKLISAVETENSGTLEGGDPLVQALEEVARANERASVVATKRLLAINSRYYAGVEILDDPRLANACTRFKATSSGLRAQIIDITSKPSKAMIYKLPIELMLHIFSYLDSEGLFACQETCQDWRMILASKDAKREVWTGAKAVVHGTFNEVDQQWTRALRSPLSPSSLFLTLWMPKEKQNYSLHWKMETLCIVKAFPSRHLQEFVFSGLLNTQEIQIWNQISRCQKLKTLHWTSDARRSFPRGYDEEDASDYGVGTTLCRLEEFTFHCKLKLRIDMAFVDMLSRVKRLSIFGGLEQIHLMAILNAAKDCLEEVIISNIGQNAWLYVRDIWIEPEPQKISWCPYLSQLKSLSVLDETLGTPAIIAPRADTLRFGHGAAIYWTTLDSCRANLKSLRIDLQGIKTEGRFGEELFDMPQLESLHLDYAYSPGTAKKLIVSYHDYSAAAFWDAINSGDRSKCVTILPKLRDLTIIHDPMLNEETFSNLIRSRALLGLPIIQKADICLANHCSAKTSKFDDLKKTHIPGLSYRTYQQWSNSNIAQWSFTATLTYTKRIDWTQIKFCRSFLNTLHLNCPVWGQRVVRKELFTMPQLEELKISFDGDYNPKKRSAAALWNAVLQGCESNDAKEKLQDILPKLKRLMILNDGLLDADTITKLIEVRRFLKLVPLQSLVVYLSRECSDNLTGLDDPTLTMPGFLYKTHAVWHGHTDFVATEFPKD